ncbi:hypothetical protein [Curtobacterium sp. YR515]|uniref:hypothetical protein n=1 Tax=Curtobacterium sp. YR515 TaxID=1855316 RepID=UPI001114064C|nr:hypothetical protein [Curtobacterium sp. YR515]
MLIVAWAADVQDSACGNAPRCGLMAVTTLAAEDRIAVDRDLAPVVGINMNTPVRPMTIVST